MEEEIKFRGKTENGLWICGDLLKSVGSAYICETYTVLGDFIQAHAKEVDTNTVGRCTGITDKNHIIDIYEGDIVKRESGMMGDEYDGFIGIVKFGEGSFVIESFDGKNGTYLWSDVQELEVLGNIYDNPRLINTNPSWSDHIKGRFERIT